MKSLKIISIASLLLAGLAFAADTAPSKDAPAAKQANCCAKAAKAGKACEHECCVEAAKAGKNCEKCGGSGALATPEKKK